MNKTLFLKFVFNTLAAVALVLVTGFATYSSPVHDAAFTPTDSIDQSHNEQGDKIHFYKCHGLVSCEIKTVAPNFRLLEARNFTSEKFEMSLSTDRSIYAIQPESPPPEA